MRSGTPQSASMNSGGQSRRSTQEVSADKIEQDNKVRSGWWGPSRVGEPKEDKHMLAPCSADSIGKS